MPNEIRVVIEDKTGSGGGSTENLTSQKASTNASAQTPQSATNRTYMKGLATASMIASGAFNYMTSNVGKYTGNSHYQTFVNNLQQGVQIGAMAIVNPYLALGAIAVQGISYVLDPHLVRGLDYYSDTVFEIEYLSDVLGNQNVICAGGRYNNLVKELGGPDIPGVGLAFGMDRILLALENENIKIVKDKELHFFLITLGNLAKEEGQKLIYDARLRGFKCDMSYQGQSLKAQFKEADYNNSLFTLILGDDEIANNNINVKNNQTKTQETVKLNELFDYLLSKINNCANCGGKCHEKSTN